MLNPDLRNQTAVVPADQWVQAVRRAWQDAGHRMTEPRDRVLRSIAAYQTPFSAEQLYADLGAAGERPGRATVYRTLDQLQGAGWLARIHTQAAETGYVLSLPGHMHHLVCTGCGAVVAFEGCALDDLLERLASQTSFAIEGHLLQLYGRCQGCQARSYNRPKHA